MRRYYDPDLNALHDLIQYSEILDDVIIRKDLVQVIEELQDLRTHIDRAWRVTYKAIEATRPR